MRSNNSVAISKSAIIRSLVVALAVSAISAIILFTLGISQVTTKAEGYLNANRSTLTKALVDANSFQIQSILMGLERFGIERTILTTNIFLQNHPKKIYSGKLNPSTSSIKAEILLTDNGLSLGKVQLYINLKSVFLIVFEEQIILLLVLLLSSLFIMILVNYVVMAELALAHSKIIDSINNGNLISSDKMTSSLLQRLFFPRALSDATEQMLSEVKYLRKQEMYYNTIKAKEKLSRQVAHDIRSPLSALNLALNFINASPDTLNLITGAIGRINNIANDLLKKEPISDTINTLEITTAVERSKQVLAEIRLRFPKSAFEFFVTEIKGGLSLQIDAIRLERMLTILLENAAEAACSSHSIISLYLNVYGSSAEFVVKDNGIGMDQKIIDRIGEVGFTSKKPTGNGIGLNYVKSHTLEAGGKFSIQSTLGVGTQVSLQFKIHELAQFSTNLA